jgi:peptide/nickel transport system substrate-binding protein
MPRRRLAALAVVLATALAPGPAAAKSVLHIVPEADLKILDTVWATNNITSNQGYMIYDVLFAATSKLEYKPQMVDTYSKSADGMVWRFRLRDGLQFSDGSPVEAKHAVASIKRYGDRIPVGKTLMAFTKEVVATGPLTFGIHLAKAFGPVLDILVTPENPLVIHREKEAMTPSDQQISEATEPARADDPSRSEDVASRCPCTSSAAVWPSSPSWGWWPSSSSPSST